MARAERAFRSLVRWLAIHVGPFVVALLVYVAARAAVELFAGLHLVLGLLLVLAFAAVAVWLPRRAPRLAHLVPTNEILAGFLMSILLAAFVGAWFSYVLHTRGLAAYRVPSPFSIGTFMDLYVFTFIGLIPGLDAWETLKITPPIEALDWHAGAPLVLFKAFVIWIFFGAVRSWWRQRAEAKTR